MTVSIRNLSFCVFAATAMLLNMCLDYAQAQDPFGDPFGGGAPAAPAGPRPPGQLGAGAPVAPAVETDPAIITIIESRPSTPEDLTKAVQLTIDLGREDLAKGYLKRLVAGGFDEVTLARLGRQFGSPFFFRLARDKTLAPDGNRVWSSRHAGDRQSRL